MDGDGHLDLLLGAVLATSPPAMAGAVDGQDSTTATNGSWPADLGGEAISVERSGRLPDRRGLGRVRPVDRPPLSNDGRRCMDRNAGSESQPEWVLESRAFLQDRMIEVGRGAYPAFTDFDADGLTDLVVACKERYYGPGNTPAMLARFRNVGTATAPAFEQLDTNWLSLPDFGVESVAPAFGDLDGDGDDDLLLGDELGNLHLWTNGASPGNPAEYTLTGPAFPSASGEPIDVDTRPALRPRWR